MSKDLGSFWRIFELRMPWAVLLPVSKGDPVIGYGWPISARIGQACLPPMQIPPVLASAADDDDILDGLA
jgi:hypothetical protein